MFGFVCSGNMGVGMSTRAFRRPTDLDPSPSPFTCMGSSWSTSCALTLMMPQGASACSGWSAFPCAAFSFRICSRLYRMMSRKVAGGGGTRALGKKRICGDGGVGTRLIHSKEERRAETAT